MRCEDCQTENPATAKFCSECGARLPRLCPACTFANLASAKFCSECGTPLPTGGLGTSLPSTLAAPSSFTTSAAPRATIGTAERRIVTVLFGDLAGSTNVAEHLDPEEYHALMNQLFRRLSDCITRYDGTIDKYIGDSLMALFGAPRAHENDPERAVRAALEMQTRLRDLAPRFEPAGVQFDMRIGINSGEVVAGDVGSNVKSDYTVMGDAVNVASGLEHEAPLGGILVSRAIYLATRWAFEYRELPPLVVKGRTEKVIAYECLGPRAQPLSARGLEGAPAPLLGRDAELQLLLDAFQACGQAEPRVVSVVGHAGIGKSRLVREFLSRLDVSGSLPPEQCWMAIVTSDRPEPFGVARQLFASAVARDSPDAAAHLRSLLGLDTGAGGRAAEESALDAEHGKQRLYLLAREVLAAHAADRRLLLVVEDLHTTDESSLDLLRFLSARPGQLQLMFLFTHRPDFTGAAAWSSRARYHSVALPPLPKEVALQLLHTYLGDSVATLPPAMVDALIQRAEGNPFYLEELVRSLIQQGVLERQERWRVAAPAEQLAVPAPIQGLLLTRMDRLSPGTRRLLQEASILGQSFPAKLLVAYSTLNGQIGQRLSELVESEWLEMTMDDADAEVTYRFHHMLLRDVAYESMLVRDRVALHRWAAELMEGQLAGQPDASLLSIAEHCYRARDAEKGPKYLEQAGDQARAIFANPEAAMCYRRALELLPERQDADLARLAVKLGDVLESQGHFDEAVESWQPMVGWYEGNNAIDQVIALYRRLAHALWSQGRVDDARRHVATALSWLEGQSDTPEAAALYQELANQALHRGDSMGAIEWSQRGLDLSQQFGAYEQASLAATTLGVALARAGEVERGRRSIELGLSIATRHALPLAAGRATLNLAVLYANSDPLRAAEICERGLAEARRVGDAAIQPWFCTALAGSLYACASDFDTAARSAETAIELDRQLGLRSHLPVPLIVLAQIDQCCGRLTEAELGYQEALSLAEQLADPQLLFPCLEGLGTLRLQSGDKEGGVAYMERAREVCESAGFSMLEMVLLPFFL